MSTILALDLGLHTGWAIYNKQDGITSGSKDFSLKKRKHHSPPRSVSFSNFEVWLRDVLRDESITCVYYEEVMGHIGTRAAHAYGAFECLMEIACYERRINPIGVPVKTIKKFATGNGNAKKENMIHAALALNINVTDDNQADAVHLLRYVLYGKGDINGEN